jgi:uncharacterized protein (DUF427 family)
MTEGHTITITPSDQHVRVLVGGKLVAESSRPVLLDETGLPRRYYLPREDVLAPLLPTSTETTCPFKGQASYWSVEVGGERHEDLAWGYERPIPEAEAITGLVSFYNDRVELVVG